MRVRLQATGHTASASVPQGDSPASIANAFAAEHKLDQEGAQAVFYHLKQKAAQKGLIKRVLYYQPFVATIDGEKKVRIPLGVLAWT
eukprot:COSAG05_NODE_580_length_8553_cov_197.460934_12_plen_87_part_00